MSKAAATGEEFDEFAADYDTALNRGISVSGEDKNYFAKGRIAFLADCLAALEQRPQSVMDFGCGTGSATPFLIDLVGARSLVGLDTSTQSLTVAQHSHGSDRVRFVPFDRYRPDADIDLVYCNGVFHHLPMNQRASAVGYVYRSLRPGGLFALWENNRWNPGTRYVMSRVPFDRDAITLSVRDARTLVTAGGFEVLRSDFLFIFPRVLNWFRRLERHISTLPLGAQYQVLCRKI